MMREVICAAKAMLNAGDRPFNDRVVVLPAIQWALNTAWWKRLQASPHHVMMGGICVRPFLLSSRGLTRVFN